MALSIGQAVFWSVLAATPPALLLFRARRRAGGFLHHVRRIAVDYRWPILMLVAVLIMKNWVDRLNHPIRGVFGDKTWLIHNIEGDAVLHLQRALEHPLLTQVLNLHYIWMYVFMNYFTIILWGYRDDRELANQAALTYLVIYVLAIPFYVFFNIQITGDFIPGMKSLLYHSSPGFYDFFVRVDPLDNAFPSLHMAIPWALILTTWWTMRRRGYTLRDWEHRHYLWFLIINTTVFAFSILYLGIHWITDIPGGLFVGLLGAIIVDEFRWDAFRAIHAGERGALAAARPFTSRLQAAGRRLQERIRRPLR